MTNFSLILDSAKKKINNVIDEPFEEPQVIKDWNNQKSAYQLGNERRQTDIASSARPIRADYVEPGAIGQIGEGFKSKATQSASIYGSLLEKLGNRLGFESVSDFGAGVSDKMQKKLASNPEWQKPEDLGKYGDPRYYTRTVTEGLTSMAMTFGASVLATIAGGPIAGLATAGVSSAGVEGGAAYQEAQKLGLTEEDAQSVSDKIGFINGALEFTPIGRLLGKSPAGKTIKKNIVKRVASEFVKQGITEGTTEAAQEIVSNVVFSEFDKDRKLFDNVLESFEAGALTGAVVGGATSFATSPEVSSALKQVKDDKRGSVTPFPEFGKKKSIENTIKDAKNVISKQLTETVQETPQTKDQFNRYKKKAPDMKFESLTDMKLIKDKNTDKVLGVANKEGQEFIFPKKEIVKKKTPHQLLIEVSERQIEQQALKDVVEPFDKKELQLFDKIRRAKNTNKFEASDFETMRKDPIWGSQVDSALEQYRDKIDPGMSDVDAFADIMELPSYKEISKPIRLNKEDQFRVDRDAVKSQIRVRRSRLRHIKNYFRLPGKEFDKVASKDFQLMSEPEFEKYLGDVMTQASGKKELLLNRSELKAYISGMEFKKVDNLRSALKLPPINKMNIEQLTELSETLDFFKQGDVFLTKRMLETIDRTEFKGAYTVRQIREKLLQLKGVTEEDLKDMDMLSINDYLPDALIAKKSKIHKWLVEDWNKLYMSSTAIYLKKKHEVNELAKAARKSRDKGFQIAVQDNEVFQWLEATPDKKIELAKNMTKEELAYGEYIMNEYIKMRDYLIENNMLNNYRENYITHLMRDVFEAWKEDGFVQAIKEIFSRERDVFVDFNSIGETDQNISFEKFFKFAQRRSGKLKPTKNVAKAFNAYTSAFEKKKAIDAIVPKMKAVSYAFKEDQSDVGKEFDRFVTEWLNTKKGIRKQYFIKRNSKADILIQMGNMAVTILDLGLSIPVGVASNVGETMMNWNDLGSKKFTKGIERQNSARGKEIAKKYENFIGENPWVDIVDAGNSLGDKFLETMFILFRDAQVRANKTYLLGSLTEQEFKTGEISDARIGEIRTAMGNYRVVSGAESIASTSPEAAVALKYKTWAIPTLLRTAYNLKKMAIQIRKDGNTKKAFESDEFKKTFRSTVTTGALALMMYMYFTADEEDKSFVGKIKQKIARESASSLSALNPNFWLTPARLGVFLRDIGDSFAMLVRIEKYKDDSKYGDEGSLKGVGKLKRTLTPSMLRYIYSGENDTKEERIINSAKDFDMDFGDDFDIDFGDDFEIDFEIDFGNEFDFSF